MFDRTASHLLSSSFFCLLAVGVTSAACSSAPSDELTDDRDDAFRFRPVSLLTCPSINPAAVLIDLPADDPEIARAASVGCGAPKLYGPSCRPTERSLVVRCPDYTSGMRWAELHAPARPTKKLLFGAQEPAASPPRLYTPDGFCDVGARYCQAGLTVCDATLPRLTAGVYVFADVNAPCTQANCPGGCMSGWVRW